MSGHAANVVQAGSIGTVTFLEAPQLPRTKPAMGPLVTEQFVNRTSERATLADLAALADPDRKRPVIVGLRGLAGVGKTTLSLWVARALAADFPDGLLYADLGPNGPSPSESMSQWLTALGVHESTMPTGFNDRAVLFRGLTADSRAILVLDDATTFAAVEPFLPTSGASLVLVLTQRVPDELRSHLTGIVQVEGLSTEHSIQLLAGICPDDRIAAESAAVAELVELCGRLPLALQIIGVHLAKRSRRTVRQVTDELRAAGGSVRAVATALDAVYAELDEPAQRLYRVLGLLSGGRFTDELIAAMTGIGPDAAITLLDWNLVSETDSGYLIHPQVRAHALLLSSTKDSDDDRAEILRRALNWWLLGATAADVALGGRRKLRIADPERLLAGQSLPSKAAARTWFEREQYGIVAAMEAAAKRQWHEPVWQLGEAMFSYFDRRRPLATWLKVMKLAAQSAKDCHDARAEARCRCLLAKAYQELERFDEAAAQLDLARELAAGDERLLASTFDFTGNLALRRKEFAVALDWFQRALEINIQLGQQRGTALMTVFVGRAQAGLGAADALATFQEAARLAREIDEPDVLIRAELGAAEVLVALGRNAEVEALLGQVAELATELKKLDVQAKVALLRADLTGDDRYREEAIAAYEAMGNTPQVARLIAG
ncbi:hypothetical protein D5S17_09935 [Pseudonocardiaceae bacterium YIM PH 21723]|nr:hypothetical protein D5S17_09935 [Pseudonocardiaceae bacterium YIM PH 21723]